MMEGLNTFTCLEIPNLAYSKPGGRQDQLIIWRKTVKRKIDETSTQLTQDCADVQQIMNESVLDTSKDEEEVL